MVGGLGQLSMSGRSLQCRSSPLGAAGHLVSQPPKTGSLNRNTPGYAYGSCMDLGGAWYVAVLALLALGRFSDADLTLV